VGRIKTPPHRTDQPRIDPQKVVAFFEERARRIPDLGPLRSVIYQDKHPELAERRDHAEKKKLLPILALTSGERVLDVGCGTGRWAEAVRCQVGAYHGIDISPGLIQHAIERFEGADHLRFSVGSVTGLSLDALGTDEAFDAIICSGILIYLNDEEIQAAAVGFVAVSRPGTRILIREPIGIGHRLTLHDHYSSELEQMYHAVYRTEGELLGLLSPVLSGVGFHVKGSGDVFDDPTLNNRVETRQRWILLEREE